MQPLVEAPGAELLEAEPPVLNRSEGGVHVRTALVHMHPPAQHVLLADLLGEPCVSDAEELPLVALSDVLGQRDAQIGHQYGILPDCLARRLRNALSASQDLFRSGRCRHLSDPALANADAVVQVGSVAMDPFRTLRVRRIAVVMAHHRSHRLLFELLQIRHKSPLLV